LGWAFKKDTNDTRESAAIYISDYLLNEQANIAVFDPQVSEKQILNDLNFLGTREANDNARLVKVEQNPYETCKDSHCVAILTEWEEFKRYDWELIYKNMKNQPFYLMVEMY